MNQLEEFINALKKESYFNRVGRGLALIAPGNWTGIVQWGEDCGYKFTLKDLLEYVATNDHIFDKIPKNSRLSDWNISTLRSSMTSKKDEI